MQKDEGNEEKEEEEEEEEEGKELEGELYWLIKCLELVIYTSISAVYELRFILIAWLSEGNVGQGESPPK